MYNKCCSSLSNVDLTILVFITLDPVLLGCGKFSMNPVSLSANWRAKLLGNLKIWELSCHAVRDRHLPSCFKVLQFILGTQHAYTPVTLINSTTHLSTRPQHWHYYDHTCSSKETDEEHYVLYSPDTSMFKWYSMYFSTCRPSAIFTCMAQC